MIIESFFFHLPRACLIKVESEVLVSTGDFRVVLTKSTVSLKRSIKKNSQRANKHCESVFLIRRK